MFLFVLCEKQEAICLFSLDNLMKEDNASEGNDSRVLVKCSLSVLLVTQTDSPLSLLSLFLISLFHTALAFFANETKIKHTSDLFAEAEASSV